MAGTADTPSKRKWRDLFFEDVHVTEPTVQFGRRRGPGEQDQNAIVASAARINLSDRRSIASARKKRQAWQSEAWEYYDEVPEVGNTLDFSADLISKVRLFAATRPDPYSAPVAVDDEDSGIDAAIGEIAIDLLERLRSIQGGQSSLLRELALNLDVAGEGYLHGSEASPDTQEEDWQIRSVDELIVEGDRYVLRSSPGSLSTEPISSDDVVIRLWARHPRFSSLATCAMRRILSVAESLVLLNRELRAISKSRMSAGILKVPSELSFGTIDPTRDQGDGEAGDDPFLQDLTEAMTMPIQNEGSAAAVVPLVVTGPSADLKSFEHISMARDTNATLDARIEGCVMRIARGLRAPVEVTCVDSETQMLTTEGWKEWFDVRPGDMALTLNHQTGLSEWKPVDEILAWNVKDHPMKRMTGRLHSSLTTLDHRWPVTNIKGQRLWRESQTLRGVDGLLRGAPCAGLPSESKYSDAFVELVAWFWTEGCFHGTGGGYIAQTERANPEAVARIRRTLTTLCGPARTGLHAASRSQKICTFEGCDFPVHGRGLCSEHRSQMRRQGVLSPVKRHKAKPVVTTPDPAWTERSGHRDSTRFAINKPLVDELRAVLDDDKVVSKDFLLSLTPAQLELYIDASVLGDGNRSRSGTIQLHQVNKARTDSFEFACILSGRSVTRAESINCSGFSPEGSPRFSLCAGSALPARVRNLRTEEAVYDGVVWCPHLENSSWLARRDGHAYFTGNTGLQETTFANASQVKKSEWDSYGEPRAVLICDSLTAGYFQPALLESGIDPMVVRDLFIWFDPSDAISAPDPTDNADKDHEDGIISDEARRRAHGWSEQDAPDDDEILRRLAFHATRMDPLIGAQILKKTGLFPDIVIPAPQNGILGDAQVPASDAQPTEKPAEPVAAAGARALKRHATLGKKLTDIDSTLRTKLKVAADSSLKRALERANNRIKSQIQREKGGEKSSIARVAAGAPDALSMASVLGHDLVASMGLTNEELLTDSFSDLESKFHKWVLEAQTKALNLYKSAGISPSAATLQEINQRQDRDRQVAWEKLRSRLISLATYKLYAGPNQSLTAAMGENDDSVDVSEGDVREALATAGGSSTMQVNGAILNEFGGPVGGVATGPTMTDMFSQEGGSIEGYEWIYGGCSTIPFPPHEDLAGVTFVNFDDDVLANNDDFPEVPYYMPGDHQNCCCDVSPTMIAPEDLS